MRLLPGAVVVLALHMGGILPGYESPRDTGQLLLPFD